jgi:ABC-type dipeptide/oligopeptide/nickel transport system permease subunit
MTALSDEALVFRPAEQRVPRPLRLVWSFVRRKPIAAASAAILLVICTLVLLAPIVATHDPNRQSLGDRLADPSTEHYLGADELGRDVFSRLLHGGRVSLGAGLGATLAGVALGVFFGLVSGYAGGFVDMIIQRVMDAIMALPPLILLMVLATTLDRNMRNVIIAIAIFVTPGAARVVRGAVLSLKEMAYVEAARALGASPPRIIFRHIMPNTFAPVIVLASITVGSVIIIEAALGYLGLSVRLPQATWGTMLNAGAQQYMEQAPWMAIAPGAAIAVTVFAINLFGDGLRDVLDPRLRGKGK